LQALEARDILSGRKVDAEKGSVLKAEMAKKNLHTKRGLSNEFFHPAFQQYGLLNMQMSMGVNGNMGMNGPPIPPLASGYVTQHTSATTAVLTGCQTLPTQSSSFTNHTQPPHQRFPENSETDYYRYGSNSYNGQSASNVDQANHARANAPHSAYGPSNNSRAQQPNQSSYTMYCNGQSIQSSAPALEHLFSSKASSPSETPRVHVQTLAAGNECITTTNAYRSDEHSTSGGLVGAQLQRTKPEELCANTAAIAVETSEGLNSLSSSSHSLHAQYTNLNDVSMSLPKRFASPTPVLSTPTDISSDSWMSSCAKTSCTTSVDNSSTSNNATNQPIAPTHGISSETLAHDFTSSSTSNLKNRFSTMFSNSNASKSLRPSLSLSINTSLANKWNKAGIATAVGPQTMHGTNLGALASPITPMINFEPASFSHAPCSTLHLTSLPAGTALEHAAEFISTLEGFQRILLSSTSKLSSGDAGVYLEFETEEQALQAREWLAISFGISEHDILCVATSGTNLYNTNGRVVENLANAVQLMRSATL
jgi:hypothetical protein